MERFEVDLRGHVPKSVLDAVLREAVSLIPVVGDAYLAYELKEALDKDDMLSAIAYAVAATPLPTPPLTHLIVYFLRSGKVGK